ncbi:MAG: HIT family protein [bacterium]
MENINISERIESECTFCRIMRGEVKSFIIFEDENTLAFLDHQPLLRGHILVIPRQHYETFLDLPHHLIQPLFSQAQVLARALELGLKADGSFIAINNRVSQRVMHLHIHVVPRWKKDGLFTRGFVWRRQPYQSQSSILTTQKAIQTALKKLKEQPP